MAQPFPSSTEEPAGRSYVFRPSLMGSEHRFTLEPDGLAFRIGRHSGRAAYGVIRRLRLSFRPVALASDRYLTEIWADGWPKLRIASTSWRGFSDQAAQTRDYADFVRELHRRVAASGGTPLCTKGSHPVLYWMGVGLFILVALAMAALIVRALQQGALAGALFVAAFFALFLWNMGGFLRKNRPSVYPVATPPDDLLPRA